MVKDFIVMLLLLTPAVVSQFECRKQKDCNELCSVCADSETEKVAICVFPFLYMFKKNKNCDKVVGCKDNCNNNGKCGIEEGGYVPSCQCKPFYYGFSCQHKSNKPGEGVVGGVGWSFNGILLVGEYVTLFFYSTSSKSPTSEAPYMTIETKDGFLFEGLGEVRSDISSKTVDHRRFSPEVRFPFRPSGINNSDNNILKFENTVLGYQTDLITTVSIDGIDYYENNFTVLVSYATVNLQCVATIELENCGSTVRDPTAYTRSNSISIRFKIKYWEDGKYVKTSLSKPECAKNSKFIWKLWKIPTKGHSENVDEPLMDIYKYKPIDFDAYSLDIGTYKILFEVKNVQTTGKSFNFAYGYFKIKGLPLVAIVDGGNDRTVSKYNGIRLSAQRSNDPNTPAAEQSHVNIAWSCVNVLNPHTLEELCKPRVFKPSDIYYIAPEMLTFGAVYNFTLKVFTDRYKDCRDCSISPTYAYVRIQVSDESEKAHTNMFIHCVRNCGVKVAPNQILFLKAAYWIDVTDTAAYNWTYCKDEGTMTPTDSIIEKDLPSNFLLVKENSFESGAMYTIVLHEISTGLVSKYSFTTDKITYEGSCSVDPSSGIKGLTLFDIVCTASQGSDFRFEFYDKNPQEIGEDKIFNGRMLGTSYTGKLLHVALTRDNVLVYIIDSYGLFASKKLKVELTDPEITDTFTKDIFKTLTDIINEGDISRTLQFISSIPDILPDSEDKSVVLDKLLNAIIQVQLCNLGDVKISSSALINVLLTLNKPTHIEVNPNLLTHTLGVVQTQASIFKNKIFYREESRWMSPKEVNQVSSSILTSLQAALMCVAGGTIGVTEDDFPLHVLYDLKQGSFYVEDSIAMIRDVTSYIQASGHPLIKVPSAKNDFIVWTIESDRTYPMTNFLHRDNEIPVKVSGRLLQTLETEARLEENVGLQVVFINNNIFPWCLSDVKSNLVSVSLTRQVNDEHLTHIKNVDTPLDIYVKLENSSSSTVVTSSTVQLDPHMTSLEKDLGVKVHRIDRAPRSLTRITFMFPPTNSTLRVFAIGEFRPDYMLMMEKSILISQQSPTYPIENHDGEEPSFLFVGILPGVEVTSGQSVSYSFEVNTTLCQFWANGQWSSSGCLIGPETSGDRVHCQCTHFSIFAAAFPVPPQAINPFEDAKLFLTVFENPLVVIFVSVILIIYLLVCLWACCKDRKDTQRRNVILLDDNYPTDKYSYLLAVYTSSRCNAGTTAHVGIRLIGASRNSRAHILSSKSRKVLKTNTDDWFLIYCPERLGELESIHLWHDNFGWSPEWFCDKIHVYDLRGRTETLFFVDQWIALSLNEFPEVSVIPARSQDVMGLKMLFVDNLLLGLRDGHVFLSAILRHPRNEVSRLQRINVFMCCLMVAMLCSIMFYIPSDVTSTDDFHYEVGTRELFISIQSLIVSGIFTCILLFSFRKSYKLKYTSFKTTMNWRDDIYYRSTIRGDVQMNLSKNNSQDVPVKLKSYDDLTNTKNSSKEVFNLQSALVQSASKDSYFETRNKLSKTSPTALSRSQSHSSQEALNKGNKTFYETFKDIVVKTLKTQTLPPVQLSSSTPIVEVNWFWLLFAWIFCITTIIVCSYLVMLYGLKLGLVKSKKWLSSVLLTTGTDVFLTGPLRIIFISVVLTMAFQKMCDVNSHAVDPKKVIRILQSRSDEEYVTKLIIKRCRPMYAPLGNDVRNAMLRKKAHWNNWWIVLYFTVSFFFVVVVSALISRLWSSHFHFNNQINKLITLSHRSEMGLYNFNQVGHIIDFENYLGYTFIDSLYNLRWYNDLHLDQEQFDLKEYWAADFTNKMIGLPLVRQLRVLPKDCGNIVLKGGKCIPVWSSQYEDKDVYGIGWTPAKLDDVNRENSPWRYTSKPTYMLFNMYRLFGVTTNPFDSGGYLATLGPSRKQAELMLGELKEHRWQDHRTKAVFVELSIYNSNLDMFSQVTLIVEYLASNKIQLSTQVETVEASVELTAWMIVFIIAILVYVCRCAYLINRMGLLGYLSDCSNVCRLIVIVLGFLALSIYVLHYYTLKQNFQLFLGKAMDSYFDYDQLTHFFILLQLVLSILLFFAILRTIILLRGGRTIVTHCYTLVISLGWIFWLTLISSVLLFVLHRISYFFNIMKGYNFKELVQNQNSMSLLTIQELEKLQVQVLVLVKTVSVSLCMGCYIVLFMHYAKIARSHRFKASDNFNFIRFLQSELLKSRKLKRK